MESLLPGFNGSISAPKAQNNYWGEGTMKKEKPHKEQPAAPARAGEEPVPPAGFFAGITGEREPGAEVQRQLAAHYAPEKGTE